MKRYYCPTCDGFKDAIEQQAHVGWEGILIVSQYCATCQNHITSYTYLPIDEAHMKEYKEKV